MKALLSLCLFLLLAGTAHANHDATIGSQEAICANAAVIMCDNFEERAIDQTDMTVHTYKNNGWSVSTTASTGPRITSDATGVYDGSRSLKLTYPAGMNNGGGFLDSSWSNLNGTSSTTLYMRWYQKYSDNFKWSYIATKNMEWILSDGSPEIFAFNNLGGTQDVTPPIQKLTKQYFYFTEQGSPWTPAAGAGAGDFTVTADTWYCLETRYTMNTTTTSTDGYFQAWVNDVLYWDNPNVNLNNTAGAQGAMTGTLVSGYWNCWGVATTGICDKSPEDDHPLMYRWIDNLVVSTSPIGCSVTGGGGGGSTPGGRAPINLFRRASAQEPTLVSR